MQFEVFWLLSYLVCAFLFRWNHSLVDVSLYWGCVLLFKGCLTSWCSCWLVCSDSECWGQRARGDWLAWSWAFNYLVVTDWQLRVRCILVRGWLIDGSFVLWITIKLPTTMLSIFLIIFVVILICYPCLIINITLSLLIVRVLRHWLNGLIDNCRISIGKLWGINFNVVWWSTFGSFIIILILRSVLLFSWKSP